MLSDLRYALRTMAKNPGFSVVAILTLALGIGANTAVFSVIDATVLRQPPYPRADRLMLPRLAVRRAPAPDEPMPWSYPKFEVLRRNDRDFQSLAAFDAENMTLTDTSADAERIRVGTVSAPYFSILGARPALGRFFTQAEDQVPGRNPVVVLSYGLWQRRYAGADVVGRAISINDVPLTVIGVARSDFEDLAGAVDLWVPMMMAPRLAYDEILQEPQSHWFEAVGRLKEGIAPSRVAADMKLVGERINAAIPAADAAWSADAVTLAEARSDPVLEKGLAILLGGVAFVLLIACVNVAGLLLARAATRRREIGLRLALGIGRARLVRQLFAESLVLSLAAGGMALMFAFWTARALATVSPGRASGLHLPSAGLQNLGAGVDLRVLAFTLLVSLIAALLFGLAPAIVASRSSVTALLRGSADAPSGPLRRVRGRALLAAAEIAIALVLLIGAGLLMQSFEKLTHVDAGFEPSNLLTLRLQPSSNAYDRKTAPLLHRRLVDALSTIPGVKAVGLDRCAPLSGACSDSMVMGVDGVEVAGVKPEIGVHFVSPDYFRAMGIPLFRGRTFTPDDSGDAPHVVVINRQAAERLWPGRDPIGREIVVGVGYFAKGRNTPIPAKVAGVVGNVRYGRPEERPRMDVYIPDFQAATPAAFVFVKGSPERPTSLAEIRDAIQSVDPKIPIFDVRPMDERAGDAAATARTGALLLSVFSGLALLLATMGVYAVMASLTRERTQEIGIRMALGASGSAVLRRVTLDALRIGVTGAVAGIGASMLLTRALEPFLYGVGARDPLTFALTAVLLLAAALAAGYLPARRASRVDPLDALRYE